ncbi:hypothetical protein KKC88_05220, partial [Patescibacteria group bacterium]|nr:hypothetical protein [Patescibacteria group bacterium]
KIRLGEKFMKKAAKASPENINAALAAWELVLRDIMLIKNQNSENIINRQAEPDLNKIAENMDNNHVKDLLERIREIKNLYKQNINYKLLLENFLINI